MPRRLRKIVRTLGAVVMVPLAVTADGRQAANPLVPAPPARVTLQAAGPVQPARVGVPFPVHVEVAPLAGIHVYAPGNKGYIPVTLALDWPRGVRARDPEYPPGEPFIFGALKELVTVYSRPFKITQRATIVPGTPPSRTRSIDVTGVLRYQACDDRLCFPLASVPVRVTIPVEPARARTRGKSG
jgi:hypothetical protein